MNKENEFLILTKRQILLLLIHKKELFRRKDLKAYKGV